eukprot:7664176-Ditylum_brightwellii.AAC.1
MELLEVLRAQKAMFSEVQRWEDCRAKGKAADEVVVGDGDGNILSCIQHLVQPLLSHIEEKGIMALELLEQEVFRADGQGNIQPR